VRGPLLGNLYLFLFTGRPRLLMYSPSSVPFPFLFLGDLRMVRDSGPRCPGVLFWPFLSISGFPPVCCFPLSMRHDDLPHPSGTFVALSPQRTVPSLPVSTPRTGNQTRDHLPAGPYRHRLPQGESVLKTILLCETPPVPHSPRPARTLLHSPWC